MIQSSTHTHLSTLLDSTRRRAALGVGIALLSCLSIGCGAEDDDTPPTMQEPEPFPLVGQWASPFGEETLTEDNWAFMTLVEHDSTLRVALTQNPADDAFNPSKYNKLVWTPPDATGSFYYCTVAFGLDTLGDARDAQDTSEATDPATSGCGGFSWTLLVPNATIAIAGTYVSGFGGDEMISAEEWDAGYIKMVVHSFNNAQRVALTQNPSDDASNPSKYNKLVWTPPDATGSFYYCTVAFGLDTLGDARDAQDTSEATDPATGGCGGFPWTPLTVKP